MKFKTVYASSIARLDSNVYTGGGTDDTAALQGILNEAGEETGIRLIMDGAALIRGLTVYSNTTIECLSKECGFFLKAGSDTNVITCGELENPDFQIHNVTFLGGTYNQDCLRQNRYSSPQAIYQPGDHPYEEVNYHAHGPYGLAFYGCRNVHVDGITIRNFKAYALVMDHFENVTIENTWLDLPDHVNNGDQDGFHFWGPGRFLTLRNVGGRVGDDFMNIGSDERDRQSSISDVLIDGVFLDSSDQAVRLLARYEGSVERVTIRNVSGTYRSFGFYICPWYMDDHSGRIADVLIENINLVAEKCNYDYRDNLLFAIGGVVESLTIQNVQHHTVSGKRTLVEVGLPFCSLDQFYQYPDLIHKQKIDGLILKDITVMEAEDAPADTDYITLYTKVDNMIVKDVTILKNQPDPNGCLIRFKEEGCIDTLVLQQVFTKGLKTLISDDSRIKTCLTSQINRS